MTDINWSPLRPLEGAGRNRDIPPDQGSCRVFVIGLLATIALAAFLPFTASATELTGKPRIVDGDTIVVLTVGGNDYQLVMFEMLLTGNPSALADETEAEVLGNLAEVVSYFDDGKYFPDGAHLYLANVYDPTDDKGRASGCFFSVDFSSIWPYFRDANEAIRDFAVDRGVAMIDMNGHFLGHGWNYDDPSLPVYHADDPSVWFSRDCIHPNNDGHHQIRRLFHAAIDGTSLPAE